MRNIAADCFLKEKEKRKEIKGNSTKEENYSIVNTVKSGKIRNITKDEINVLEV